MDSQLAISNTSLAVIAGDVVNPDDPELQQRLQLAFFIKTQRPEVLGADSTYRILARRALLNMAERGYSPEDMERAIQRFETTKQFGERIEIADFFEVEPERLHTESWKFQQMHEKGYKNEDFDGYRVGGNKVLLWRIHDGTILRNRNTVLIVWAGRTREIERKLLTAS